MKQMIDIFQKYELKVDDAVLTKFEDYYRFLVEYNEHTNLTAITKEDEVYYKHFLDSVLPANAIKQNAKLIDIGTGAGFPGVPIKILRNDISITLVDSLQKRTEFLHQLCKKLNIDADILHARAEDACKQMRESFDYCVSRAVAKLNTLAEWCLPFVKVGGYFLAYKSGDSEIEIQESASAIKVLGGEIEKIEKFSLPHEMGERTIIFVKKIKNTPKIYPRGKNLAKNQPIINKI